MKTMFFRLWVHPAFGVGGCDVSRVMVGRPTAAETDVAVGALAAAITFDLEVIKKGLSMLLYDLL
tara:strand:+ start:625 stop:819 length:195 start_codon:yes stop_codon:yes gene_type:complete